MLSIITNTQDPLLDYVKDDPVRPEISREFRVGPNRFVSALVEETEPTATAELGESEGKTTAVFYTIWSYKAGAGQKLLRETVAEIKRTHPTVKRFVTLSPKTEMARRFHTKNGAEVLQDNADSVNYEYKNV
jgi:hypothetical protein